MSFFSEAIIMGKLSAIKLCYIAVIKMKFKKNWISYVKPPGRERMITMKVFFLSCKKSFANLVHQLLQKINFALKVQKRVRV